VDKEKVKVTTCHMTLNMWRGKEIHSSPRRGGELNYRAKLMVDHSSPRRGGELNYRAKLMVDENVVFDDGISFREFDRAKIIKFALMVKKFCTRLS